MSSKVRIWFLILMMASVTNLFAQVTTSSMSGLVTDNGKPVAGAKVVATHVPTGTIYTTVTNADGRYAINGMKVGNDYEVDITASGHDKYVVNDLTLALGQNYPLDVALDQQTKTIQQVVITGLQRTKFNETKTGASTNISNAQIQEMPMISRSISDIAKLSPYANGMSIGGGDGRSTNFTVDGANFNNNFGLSSSLPGGGNPISLDAIEEMQVVMAPFDVRQTNFIGGGINAITKSGSNKFTGSLYNYFTTEQLRGNTVNGQNLGTRAIDQKYIYGGTVGGRIIKNKLFFFLNLEQTESPDQVVTWRPSPNGQMDINNNLSRTSISDMETVRNFLISKYHYDPGSFENYPSNEKNKKILARLDWNINQANKLTLRYNRTENTSWFPTNATSTSGTRLTFGRISQYSMAFSNSMYSMQNNVTSVALDLNSRISNNISNQLLATYTNIEDVRGSNSNPFPFVDIMDGRNSNGNQILEPYMSFGYELFSWNNGVHNKVYSVTDNLSAFFGNHKLTAGFRFEHQMANNSFMRNGTGYYRYSSMDDFLTGAAPETFALTYGYDGDLNPAATVNFNQYGLYVQDEWSLTDRFKLSFGTRADLIKYENNLIPNNAISALDYGGRHINVGAWPKSNVQFSPRLGFSYDARGDKSLILRGGTGVFTGRLPLVFFTNMPTNGNMIQNVFAMGTTYKNGLVTGADPRLQLLKGGLVTNVNDMIAKLGLPTTISPAQGLVGSEVDGVDPNFKMPQVWKSALGIDYVVPASFPLTISVEGTYTKTLQEVMLKNYNVNGPDGWDRFEGSDNRLIYPKNYQYVYDSKGNPINGYVLSNTTQGWAATGNITIKARPVRNLDLMAAYTHTESKEISGMPGSQASSAYTNLIEVNGPAFPALQRSQYVTPDKVIGSFNYKIDYANDKLSTIIGLFYSGFSPNGASYMYTNDMNGDGSSNDLIYIPKGRGDIEFTSQADEDAYFAYAAQDKYLSKHKGQYAQAYKVMAPWLSRVDLHLVQEFKVGVEGNKNRLQIIFDILNFGNLLNNKWGVTKDMNISNNGRILTYSGIDAATGKPTYSFFKPKNGDYPTKTFDYDYYFTQTWQMQIGLRYIFN